MNALFAFCVFLYICGQILSLNLEGSSGLATTHLTADLTSTATTASVQGTDGFLKSDFLIVENERICYSGKTSSSFTGLTRGCHDSTASSHSKNIRVYNETTGMVNQMVGFNVLQTFADDGFFKGVTKFITSFGHLFVSIANMLAWNYSFLEGNGVYIKYIMLYPISAAMILYLVNLVFRRGN